jgi:hypothetical protein
LETGGKVRAAAWRVNGQQVIFRDGRNLIAQAAPDQPLGRHAPLFAGEMIGTWHPVGRRSRVGGQYFRVPWHSPREIC